MDPHGPQAAGPPRLLVRSEIVLRPVELNLPQTARSAEERAGIVRHE